MCVYKCVYLLAIVEESMADTSSVCMHCTPPPHVQVNASPSLTANTREDYLMKTEMLHGMLDVVDMEQLLEGDEEHVSGWDLVYDNGYIEIDPAQCGYTSFLGAAVPEPDVERETDGQSEDGEQRRRTDVGESKTG